MRLIKLDYSKQFESLFDYYYDNIHWADSDLMPNSSFAKCLYKEYDAIYNFMDQSILFKDDKKYTHFSLKWL